MHPLVAKRKFDAERTYLSEEFLLSRRWELREFEFPHITVLFQGQRPLLIRLTCDNWDEVPPSAEIMEADGTPMGPCSGSSIFHSDHHPDTSKPFLCMRGIREFHTHPSHRNEVWDNYRGRDGMNLVGLLDQLSRAWRKAAGK